MTEGVVDKEATFEDVPGKVFFDFMMENTGELWVRLKGVNAAFVADITGDAWAQGTPQAEGGVYIDIKDKNTPWGRYYNEKMGKTLLYPGGPGFHTPDGAKVELLYGLVNIPMGFWGGDIDIKVTAWNTDANAGNMSIKIAHKGAKRPGMGYNLSYHHTKR